MINKMGKQRNRKAKDLTGEKFGKLTILSQGENDYDAAGRSYVTWNCLCECGNTKKIRAGALKSGLTTSCGCARKGANLNKNTKDLTGQTFHYWTVIEQDPERTKSRSVRWICQCKCGTVKSIIGSSLINGISKSCGCYKLEILSNTLHLENQKIGRWTVLTQAETTQQYGRNVKMWNCKCECGTLRAIPETSLIAKTSLSCGCLRDEKLSTIRITKDTPSKSEEWVTNYLETRNYDYQVQISFPDFKPKLDGVRPSFDFMINNPCGPNILIECQGAQHYEIVEHWGGEDKLRKQKERDENKRKYCHARGFILIEIDARFIRSYDGTQMYLDEIIEKLGFKIGKLLTNGEASLLFKKEDTII